MRTLAFRCWCVTALRPTLRLVGKAHPRRFRWLIGSTWSGARALRWRRSCVAADAASTRNRPPAPPLPPGLASPRLRPFVDYLAARWQAGGRNVAQLHRELAALGCHVSYSLVQQALRPWRGPPSPEADGRRRRGRPRLKRYNTRWLCLRPPDQLEQDERVALDQLLAQDPEVARGYALLQRFRGPQLSRQAPQTCRLRALLLAPTPCTRHYRLVADWITQAVAPRTGWVHASCGRAHSLQGIEITRPASRNAVHCSGYLGLDQEPGSLGACQRTPLPTLSVTNSRTCMCTRPQPSSALSCFVPQRSACPQHKTASARRAN
jgi:hypothetical protein